MFSYRIKIGLGSTDATGVLFFPEQFVFAMQTFEAFLESRQFPLSTLFTTPYLFPVVHAEGDYLQPLPVGSEIEITLEVEKVGFSSVTVAYLVHLVKTGEKVGSVRLVHVAVDRQTREKREIPSEFRNLFLESLQKDALPQEV